MSSLSRISLSKKLIGFAAVLVLVPGILLAVLAERSGRDTLEKVIGRELAREAAHLADRIEARVRAEREAVDRFARQDLMREILVSDLDKRIALSLMTLRSGSPERVAYLVVDPSERVIASSDPAHLESPPAWLEPRAGGVQQAELAALPDGRIALLLSERIPDPDRPARSLGRLIAVLDWARLTSAMDTVRLDLADEDIAARILIIDSSSEILRSSASQEDAIADESARALARSARETKSGLDTVTSRSGDWIAGRAPIELSLPRATLLVLAPASDAFAPAVRLRDRLSLITIAALAVGLLAAAFGAGRVGRPLTELTEAIQDMARGERREVPVRSEDEVGQLARAFNDMIADLDAAQRNLIEAEKFAFVGELAAGVAHQVRTSLGVLGNSAKLLERSVRDDADPAACEMIAMISSEVGRLARVVDDLLTLDVQRPLDLQPRDLCTPLRAAIRFIEPQASQKGVRIESRLPTAGPSVRLDADALEQVCLNLLSNAIGSLETGGRIEVALLAHPPPGSTGFRVCDDGPGVPEALRQRIFDPFVTGRSSGVGLGLTFVKKTVHAHHGSVRLEPRADSGACFVVELPRSEVDS
jgi:signal transduction histidine kinase